MIYEITRSDGTTSRMRLLVPETTIESEILKWHPDDHGTVVSWRAIEEHELVARDPPTPLAVDLTGLPDTIRDVLISMGEVISTMQGQRDQDRAQIAALAQLRDHDQQRIAQLEQTNQVISQKLLRD